MELSMAKKHRPQTFSEVFGNTEEISSLEKIIKDKSVSTFLFQGDRGCGKSTCARIAAKELGASAIGTTELNISDARGIEDARNIIESCQYLPRDGGSNVFILNEIQGANKFFQNTLLEILEEPPKKTYFILCTTNPESLIAPIRSRCSQFTFAPLSSISARKFIKSILDKEEKELSKDVIKEISKKTDGIPRETLSLLEKVLCADTEKKQLRIIKDYSGSSEDEAVIDLCRAFMNNSSWKEISKILKTIKVDPESVRYGVLGYFNSVLLNKGNFFSAGVIETFSESFINSGKAGLTLACYTVVCGDNN